MQSGIGGTYPMLFASFGAEGAVLRAPVAIQTAPEALGIGRMAAKNDRERPELTDNYRAVCGGMISAIEAIDVRVAIERAMRAGDEEGGGGAVSPSFAQRHLCHAWPAASGAVRQDHCRWLGPSAGPNLCDTATPQGPAWAARLARDLGPLP